jgi:hypothetical protein
LATRRRMHDLQFANDLCNQWNRGLKRIIAEVYFSTIAEWCLNEHWRRKTNSSTKLAHNEGAPTLWAARKVCVLQLPPKL